MFFLLNQSVGKIVLLSSVFFCVCDCGDWDDIFVYENDNVTTSFPWLKNWTLSTTTEYITTTTDSTTTTTTERPTTEQEQQHTRMDEHSYGIRSENERSFEFLLPKTLKTEDSVTVSGLLRDRPKIVKLSLATGYNGVDYSNVAFEFVVTIFEGGDDIVQVYNTLNGTRELLKELSLGPLFIDSKFNFDVTIESESEEGFAFDLYTESNGGLVQGMQLKHHLRDVKYLILSGDCEKVDRLQFEFA